MRIEHGFTTTQMGEYLNITQSAYSKLERGQSKLDIDRLNRIAEIFSLPPHEFFSSEKTCNCMHELSELKKLIQLLIKELRSGTETTLRKKKVN